MVRLRPWNMWPGAEHMSRQGLNRRAEMLGSHAWERTKVTEHFYP